MQNTRQKVNHPKVKFKALGFIIVVLALFLSACGTPAPEVTEQLDSNATWVKISDEKRNFTVSGTKTVRYGAGSRWVQRSVTGSGYCGNWFFGSDPASGVVKSCEVLQSNTTTPTTPTNPNPTNPTNPTSPTATWTKIADEKTNFTLTETKTIRFGTDNRWLERTLTAGTHYCHRSIFGGSDPAEGVFKRCEVRSTSAAPQQPAPQEPAPQEPRPQEPTPQQPQQPTPVPTPIDTGRTVTVSFQKDNSNFLNPERGYSNPQVSYSDNPKALESWRLEQTKAQGISVINRRYVMVTFRNSPISQSYLDHIQADMNLVRQYGMKMVIRFSYTFNEPQSQGGYADTNMNRMLSHVEQLRPLLQRNSDIIAFLEAGFIGRWGEWNKSTNGLGDETNPQNSSEQGRLVNALLNAMPRERMITLRYYGRKHAILGSTAQSASTAYSSANASRVGHMNDYFTIDSYSGSARSYLMQDTLWTVHGGEPIRTNGARSECPATMGELVDYHWSVMNIPGSDFTSIWRNGGCYDSIAKRLGYRFFLNNATLPTAVNAGSTLSVTLSMTNEGFARPFNPRGLELVLRNRNNGQVTRLAVNPGQDVRAFLPGPAETKSLTLNVNVPGNLASGNYDISLNMPDPASSLNNRADYSIRLANSNIWDSATGYNRLGSIQVGTNANLLANAQ
jgi:hypothetical protein